MKKFKDTDFFKDPNQQANDRPDGKEKEENKVYPIYHADKLPYYNREDKKHKGYEEQQFKKPNLFAVGIVNADDIESHMELRKSKQILIYLRLNQETH